MKSIPTLILGGALFLAPWSLAAQSLTLDDFDGTVEVKTGSTWKAIDIGTKVPYEATVRIGNHGLAEFQDGTLRIHLSKDGSYQLSALAAKAKNAPTPTLLSQTAGKVGMMLGDKGQAKGAVPVANMGARGAEVDPSAGLTWSEDDTSTDTPTSASVLADIEALASAGKLNQAMAKTDAALQAPGAEKSGLRLMKARILAQMGRSASSLREALAAAIAPASPYYSASVLLISTQALLVEDWDQALQKAQEGRTATQDPDVGQNLDLIQALAFQGQGQTQAAQDMLQKVVNEDPTSGAGQQAAKLLKS